MRVLVAVLRRKLCVYNSLLQVCGCVEPEERDPILYNNTYPERFLKFKETWGFTRINLTGVKELLWKSGWS